MVQKSTYQNRNTALTKEVINHMHLQFDIESKVTLEENQNDRLTLPHEKKKISILKETTLTGTLLALSTLGVLSVRKYQQWHADELDHIKKKSSILDTPFGKVEYKVIGSGPTILFSHGTPGGYDQSEAMAKILGLDGFRIICISRPGYIRTALTLGKTPEEQADLFSAVLNTLGIEQTTILGFSGGGPAALEFARRHPKKCAGIILLSALLESYDEAKVLASIPVYEKVMNKLSDALFFADPIWYLLLMADIMQLRSYIPAELLHSMTIAALRKEGYQNDMDQFTRLSSFPYHDIVQPILLIHGANDTFLPFARNEELAMQFSKIQIEKIEHAGHFAFLSHKHQVKEAMQRFLLERSSMKEINKAFYQSFSY